MSNQNKIYNFLKENVFYKKILFEKYDRTIDDVLLIDFENSEFFGDKIVDFNYIDFIIKNKSFDSNSVLGETFFLANNGTADIDMRNVTHIIKNAYLVNKKIYGKVEFLNTPYGVDSKKNFENGANFSLRAIGNLCPDNFVNIIEIITWDLIITKNKI